MYKAVFDSLSVVFDGVKDCRDFHKIRPRTGDEVKLHRAKGKKKGEMGCFDSASTRLRRAQRDNNFKKDDVLILPSG